MTTKLTLSIDEEVIKNAKRFSKKNGISVSRMVEIFLKQSVKTSPAKSTVKKEELPPLLKKMYGAAKTKDNRKYRDVYREYIIEKYAK